MAVRASRRAEPAQGDRRDVRDRRHPDAADGILAGRRLLITGVATTRSIAWAVAREAQLQGAEIVLSGFGRMRRMTERAAARLPRTPDVIELDVTRSGDLAAVGESLGRRLGGLDGALHAIAFAPAGAMSGDFLATPTDDAMTALEISAISFRDLARVLTPLLRRDGGQTSSLVSLSFDSTAAWPSYDWMGVAKATLESITRYLARDLGPLGIRVNSLACAPILTVAADRIPAFDEISAAYRSRAPLGWDDRDATPIAGAASFLFSNLARGMTGQVLRVDGGAHAVGCAIEPTGDGRREHS